MITKVKLPKADANMNEGTIGKWLFEEGDKIAKGDHIVEVITDKAVFEIESPKGGVLRKIIAPTNSVIHPGYVMALIGKPDDDLPDVEKYNRKLLDQYKKEQELELEKSPVAKKKKTTDKSRKGKLRATPSAKRLARENKLELSEIKAMFDVEVINEKIVKEFLAKN